MATGIAVRVSSIQIPERGDQKFCCTVVSAFAIECGSARLGICLPAQRLRAVPRPAAEPQPASISSTLEELANMVPHVHLPRFPPVARRLREAIQGKPSQQQACENGRSVRKKTDKHTLSTRDVHTEPDVIALESTGGRKRVYKRRDGAHPDGSFDMVQV
jgi:hypothetical protein